MKLGAFLVIGGLILIVERMISCVISQNPLIFVQAIVLGGLPFFFGMRRIDKYMKHNEIKSSFRAKK